MTGGRADLTGLGVIVVWLAFAAAIGELSRSSPRLGPTATAHRCARLEAMLCNQLRHLRLCGGPLKDASSAAVIEPDRKPIAGEAR